MKQFKALLREGWGVNNPTSARRNACFNPSCGYAALRNLRNLCFSFSTRGTRGTKIAQISQVQSTAW
jgi:hypothetical protein